MRIIRYIVFKNSLILNTNMNIVVNDQTIKFNHEDFPMLISGSPSTGSSFFSIELMVNLFQNGEKVVLFSAYEQAKELFKKEVGDSTNENILIIESGDDNKFIEELSAISDLSERIVLYKNIDNYDVKLFNQLKDRKLVIFSGNLDACQFKDELLKKEFKTKIFFSYPKDVEIEDKIELPKYCAFIINNKYQGIITMKN